MVKEKNEKVAIYGIGDNFIRYYRTIFEKFCVVCLIDSDVNKQNTQINGINVISCEEFSPDICNVIIVTPNSFGEIKRSIREKLNDSVEIRSLFDYVEKSAFKEVIHLGIINRGDLTDYLMNINYAIALHEKFNQINHDITIFRSTEMHLAAYVENEIELKYERMKFVGIEKCEKDEFDIIIQIQKYPEFVKFDSKKMGIRHEELIDYYFICEKFRLLNPRFFSEKVNVYGGAVLLEKIQGRKRFQQPDIGGYLEINHINMLNSMDSRKDILLFSNGEGLPWGCEIISVLSKFLKGQYMDYRILQISVDSSNNRYALEEEGVKRWLDDRNVIDLLIKSVLFISCENSLVHLRKVLTDKKSIVIFGPTSSLFYGYSQNWNVKKNNCVDSCEGVSSCEKTCCNIEQFKCLAAVSIEEVLGIANKNEDKWKI